MSKAEDWSRQFIEINKDRPNDKRNGLKMEVLDNGRLKLTHYYDVGLGDDDDARRYFELEVTQCRPLLQFLKTYYE